MFQFLNDIKEITPDLELLGIAITKADERKGYFKQTIDSLRELEGKHLFDNFIRVDSAVEWAQEHSKPVLVYKKSSRSSKEYLELSKEVDNLVRR
jgi:chromosome partitioning protein